MSLNIKPEIESLMHKAAKIRDKLESLMTDPVNDEKVGSLNYQLDNLIELLGLTPGPEVDDTDHLTD